jgi:hypothetical protein
MLVFSRKRGGILINIGAFDLYAYTLGKKSTDYADFHRLKGYLAPKSALIGEICGLLFSKKAVAISPGFAG